MDARLRILLRRYTASHDPEDAVAFVNNYLRSFEGEALDEIQVWSKDAASKPRLR